MVRVVSVSMECLSVREEHAHEWYCSEHIDEQSLGTQIKTEIETKEVERSRTRILIGSEAKREGIQL